MVARIAQWTLDVQELGLMAEFWSAALDLRVERGDDGGAKLYPRDGAAADVPTVWLQPTAPAKSGKNRLHPDLRPVDGDLDAEVERLIALGAVRADVGQTGDEPFVVLGDPEGNEFCVLRNEPREV
jgi:hypothetical protein